MLYTHMLGFITMEEYFYYVEYSRVNRSWDGLGKFLDDNPAIKRKIKNGIRRQIA